MSTSFLPEPPTPVAEVAPFQPVKAKRKSWTQTMVAELVFCSTQPGFIANAEQHAKLVELGLRKKPPKPSLDDFDRETLNEFVAAVAGYGDDSGQQLPVRYAIKQLQALLPKRPAK